MTDKDRPAERSIQTERLDAAARLAGGLAHDFNNFLTAILLNADLLESRLEKDPALASLAASIREAAECAADITKRLAAFGGRRPLDIRPTDIDALIVDLEPVVREAAGSKVTITTVLSRNNAMANTDADALRSALMYLVANACEAMPDGGTLTLTTHTVTLNEEAAVQRGLLPGDYVTVAVSDTGTGLAADVAARAFEPFVSTKPREIGTGLGLSLVYGFARQCDGHAEISAQAGGGTRVTLYLPAAA